MLHKWKVRLYPLKVVYSPTLRLRYRVLWDQEAKALNCNTGVAVFREPVMAESAPVVAPGLVYIEDSRDNSCDPHVFINFDGDEAVSAIVQLPVNEKDCESCSCVVKDAISLLFDFNL